MSPGSLATIEEFDPLASIVPDLDLLKVGDIDVSEEAENDSAGLFEVDLSVPQISFFELEAKYPLFVAGFGSGKSKTLALCAVRDLVNFPGANIAVYAPTYDLLSLILVPYISEVLEDGGYTYRHYGGNQNYFSVKGYGHIICRSLSNPARIVGYETFRAHCDELDTLPLERAEEAWNKVIARNRQKVFKRDQNGKRVPEIDEDNGGTLLDDVGNVVYQMHQNRISAYTTPEGWNFAWKRWVKMKKEGDGYELVKASTYSNAHNLPDDYIDNLAKSYPPELFDAYVNGEFTNLTSGRVYRSYDRTENNSTETAQPNDILHVGVDFNIEHGAAVVIVERKNKDTKEVEYHAVDEVADSYDTDDTIRILKERYPNHAVYIYPDASGAHRNSANGGLDSKGRATSTDIAKLRRVEGWTVKVDHSNPAIKDRVSAVSGLICNAKKVRRFFVNQEKCPSLCETLEQQVWANGVPDKSTGLDHMGDAAGYAIYKLEPPIRVKNGFVRVSR